MKKNKPEIRFKGFEEEWEETTLGKCFDERNERSANGELISVTINYGVIRASELDRIDNSSSDKSNYKVVKVGDIAYNSMRMWQGASGYSAYEGICSPAYTVVIPKEGVDVVFFSYLFKRNDSLYQFRINSQGLTSDTWNLKYPAFAKLDNVKPSEEEQKKIATLLSTLDKLIRKLELKLEKLRNIKQSLLSQMFTNVNGGGYAVPLIRFKNYNNNWQMKKAVDIFIPFEEKNYPELPVLSANQELGMVARSDIGFNVQHDHRNESGYKRVMPGQFVIHLRSFQGGFAHSEIEGITSPAYTIMGFKSSNEHYDIFWKYLLTSKDFIKSLETVTYGIRDGRSIGFKDFGMLMQTYPRREEQKQIAKLLTITDDYIKMNDAKLAKIRTMKQSLLQKMFA